MERIPQPPSGQLQRDAQQTPRKRSKWNLTMASFWPHWRPSSSQRNFHCTSLGCLDGNSPNDGRRQGWWGLPEPVEAFLDQVITWRDIGFIHCAMIPDHTEYSSLPQWAQNTLAEHSQDPRSYVYTFEQFEQAQTHDPLWNAAQQQLRQEGIIHNYLRMLWGKKILEWSPDPQTAMEWMIAINDRWALDGRDPNSYTGIGWVMGKFDRGWTEREVYGKIRCMTTASTMRKFKTKDYIEKYSKDSTKQTVLGSGPSLYTAHQ